MSAAQLIAILPLLVLAAGATLIMLQIAFARSVVTSGTLTIVTLLLAALSVTVAVDQEGIGVTPLLLADHAALLFSALFCLAGAVTALLSMDYIRHHGDEPEEYFLLLILSTLGACVLVYAVHLAALLLGLELLSVALYALIAYPNRSILPLEAAIKYLVLSGAASATILFGFALLYAATGSLEFDTIGRQLEQPEMGPAVLMVAAAMAFTGMAFKLSLVPFHLWTPDVYDGAPAPVTGFLASVAKAAVLVVLLRIFLSLDLFRYHRLVELTGLMAIMSMLAGNLLALQQTNIKRMLAYSSIAHIGYLVIVFMVCSNSENRSLAVEAAMFYLVAYTATTIAAFGLLTLISAERDDRERVQLQDVGGLFWRQPLLAGLLLVALLSLAGIPLTAGFVAKFYIVSAAVSGPHWVLLAALVVGSGLGIYYYLRVVYYMSLKPRDQQQVSAARPHWRTTSVCLFLIATILLLGTIPQTLMEHLRSIL